MAGPRAPDLPSQTPAASGQAGSTFHEDAVEQEEIRATYRLQLRPGFGFDEAAALADYLAALGVSHLYSSPCLEARSGSSHGYDVVDHQTVRRDFGGEAGHERLCAALAAHGLGQVLDIVPNHMAIGGPENPWWWDVLENGPSSRWAAYFDVDWEPPEARLRNAVLLPVLGDHYGRVLEAGQLRVVRRGGRFVIHYHSHEFPVAPRSLYGLLAEAAERCGCDELAFVADSYDQLPLPTATDAESLRRRHRDKEVVRVLLERLLDQRPDCAQAIDARLDEMNADPDALDEFLERQNHRLALWRSAGQDLGYRRFFDVNSLIGLRTEEATVFEDTHALVLRWLAEGKLAGLRVDHVDGLRDPLAYLTRLRRAAPRAWIVVEKILHGDETLPRDWPVEGTSGYEFLNRAGGLFIDPAGEAGLTNLYVEFTGRVGDFETLARDKKRLVLRDLLGGDLNRLTALLLKICERHRRHRDYTRHELRRALGEVAACLPVYRTYVDARSGRAGADDLRRIGDAVALAKVECPELDGELLDFLGGILSLRVPGEVEGELAMRFQQLTGPATAKGIEDTALYCYHRLVALNEVGSDPAKFGVSVDSFHADCVESQRRWPRAMLTTATHDTKRGEDVRARLALLSEIPDRWAAAVRRWAERNEPARRDDRPDRNAEYLLYQTLVGAWPIATDRVTSYMEKAGREAKLHTSWVRQDPEYEAGVRGFVERILDDSGFLADLEEFVAPLVAAGRVNSLAQKLLALTAPGIPDIYQGTELWELSLVDPDNRRPVDFARRRQLLAALEGATPEGILARADEGLPKLWVVSRALSLRRRSGAFGPRGDYVPLPARGARAAHVVAFARGGAAVTVVPRLVLGLAGDWRDTTIELPGRAWRNELTGDELPGGVTQLATLLARFPVALLSAAA